MKFHFWGYSCPSRVTRGQRVHSVPAPIATLRASVWCWGQAAGCLGHPACGGYMHSHPSSPTSPSSPTPHRIAARPLSCDWSGAANTVSKSLEAEMCVLLSLVQLGDQHPPASCCSSERLSEAPCDRRAEDPLALAVGSRGSCPPLFLSGDPLCQWLLGKMLLMALMAHTSRQHSLARGAEGEALAAPQPG